MPTTRLPLPAAFCDPAFVRCAHECIETPELVSNFNRLYGAKLGETSPPLDADMQAFTEFVHDSVYMRLPDEAIDALRATAKT